MSVWILGVAALRVAESGLRRSTLVRRTLRSSLALLARRSGEARTFVRLRVMRMF